jgi:uncharacterized protein YqeY
MVTLIELKKAKMVALKNHDTNAQNVLGVMIAYYQKAEVDKKAAGKEMSDADIVSILNKTLKELEDEKAMYAAAGRSEDAANDDAQIAIVKSYMPQMMSEEEVRKVIEGLADKSIKSVMAEFKTNYAGKADMGMVSRLAKEYQGK